jgi:hypothetical protein
MRKLSCLLVVAFVTLGAINTLHADVAHVVVPVDAEVQTAVGIIISQGETKQVRVANPKARDEHSVVVEVPYSDADRRAGGLATALVSLKNGSVALADVVSLQADFPDNSFKDIPLCDANLKMPVLSESQLGNLKRLGEIRSQRRAVLQTKMARLLQGTSLEKLRKLERGFGTGTGVPLSPALLPFELVDRLSRLKQAISTYETNRQK